MRKCINIIKRTYKNHPRVIVMSLVLILFIVILLIFKLADKYLDFSNNYEKDYYVYTGEVKVDFRSNITTNRDGVINAFEPNKIISFGTLPIYSEDEIILPSDMIITLFDTNTREYKLSPYTMIKDDKIITDGYKSGIDTYFIYDGKSLYLFNNSGSLKIDDKVVELSEYSYVICNSTTVEYYDYKSDEYKVIDYKKDVTFDAKSYIVDLKNGTVGNDNNLLPKSVEHLSFIKEYKNLQK